MPNIAVFPELLRTHKPGSFPSLDESLEVQAAIARLLQADQNLRCCQEELCSQQPRSLFVQQGSGKRSPALFFFPFYFLVVVGLFWPQTGCLILGLLGIERRCALLGCPLYLQDQPTLLGPDCFLLPFPTSKAVLGMRRISWTMSGWLSPVLVTQLTPGCAMQQSGISGWKWAL